MECLHLKSSVLYFSCLNCGARCDEIRALAIHVFHYLLLKITEAQNGSGQRVYVKNLIKKKKHLVAHDELSHLSIFGCFHSHL